MQRDDGEQVTGLKGEEHTPNIVTIMSGMRQSSEYSKETTLFVHFVTIRAMEKTKIKRDKVRKTVEMHARRGIESTVW